MSVPDPSAVDWVPLYNTAASGIPPAVNGQWLKGVGGVPVWSPITQQDVTLTPYGTTLPASPFDGQEAILVDAIATPKYVWRFRYHAGSTSAYKWEFIGGGWFWVQIDQADSVPNGWVNVNPGLTVPRAGEYEVQVRAMFVMSSTGVLIGFGAGVSGQDGYTTTHATNGGQYHMLAAHSPGGLALASGATLWSWCYTSAGTHQIQQRLLAIKPRRVS